LKAPSNHSLLGHSSFGRLAFGHLGACICLYLAVIVAGLATNPFFDMGVNDDWSYSRTAMDLARTGHIHYFGWSASAMLAQLPYGALWIKLFGGSFATLRVATLALSGLIPVLTYWLGLECSLERRMAFFGAMTVGLSPLFIPHSVSFMSDSYACLFFLASMLLAMKSIVHRPPVPAAALYALAMLSSLLGGATRQVFWVTAPVIAAAYCFFRRGKSFEKVWGGGVLVAYIACCVFILHWLRQQPNFLYENLNLQMLALSRQGLMNVIHQYGGLILTALVFAIPSLVPAARLRLPALDVACAVLVAGVVFAATFWLRALIFPYLNNVVTQYGLYQPGLLLPGALPVILPATFCRAITAAVAGLLFLLFSHGRAPAASGVDDAPVTGPTEDSSVHSPRAGTGTAILFLWTGSTMAYLFAFIGRAKAADLFDRYAMPFLPLLILGILIVLQRNGVPDPGRAAWAMVLLFGVYGVAITHDHFEQMRTQRLALNLLKDARIPRENIVGGMEDDMWTQVDLDGRLIATPDASGADLPVYLHPGYLKLTPRIKPHYLISTSNLPGAAGCKFEPLVYSTWLFPRDRELFVLCLP